jgi:glycosyltransferase involved in cell wall biosynthesis
LYFVAHLLGWVFRLAKDRPQVAHYAINSGWAMEKGLIFLKVARFFGAKTIGHLHGGLFLDFLTTIPQNRRAFAVKQIGKLDGMIVLSEGWRKAVESRFGLPPEKLFVVNNPIEQEFEKAALEMPVLRDSNVIMSLGIMERIKGVLDLLKAATIVRQHNSFSLRVIGPEREPGILKDALAYILDHSLTETVTVQAGVWGAQKIEAFRNASIFVLPSYVENFPLVVLEAAAAGLAIVTTPVGATPEFFRDKHSALFVEPGNHAQIASALTMLLENPAERQRLGEAARNVFRTRLARSKIMESLDSVYRQILAA